MKREVFGDILSGSIIWNRRKKIVIKEEVLEDQVLFLHQNVVKEVEEIGTVAQIDC